jgi:RNA polymerase sigma factor (sigma-70 family)
VDPAEYATAEGGSLLKLACSLMGSQHGAEDLVQTTLLKATKSWRRIETANNPDAYVKKMLVHEFLNEQRRITRLGRFLSLYSQTTRDRSEDMAAQVVESHVVLQALMRLKPKARTVLVLTYYDDLDDEEIAQLIDSPKATVRSIRSRALAQLRTVLQRSEDKDANAPV